MLMFKFLESAIYNKSLIALLIKIKNIWGIDRAVFYSLLYRTWGVISFPITLWLIITKFLPEIQGYHYTFMSLLFLQIFLELGFGLVMVQFISHEWAHLKLSTHNRIEGDPKALARLASLVNLGIKWYLALSLLFLAIIGTGGYLFLLQHKADIDIQMPWWLLCAAVSLSIILLPMRCCLEGSNRIDVSQQIYLKSSIFSSVAGWAAIYSGANLYTAAIMSGTSAVVSFLLLSKTFIPFYKILKINKDPYRISWKKEFWPQQWRIGVSWLSGFFMFQSFVPIMFQLHGPIVAGQMGATMQIYNGLNAIAQSWVSAVAPKMGILGAKKDIPVLKSLVKHTYLRSLAASIIFSIVAFLIISLLYFYDMPQAKRLAELFSVGILLFTLIAMQLPNVETTAVRFQKQEPFVTVAVICAFLVILSNLLLGKLFGINGVVVGFAGIMLLILIPWCHIIYSEVMKMLYLNSKEVS